jgi:hypothetical protein
LKHERCLAKSGANPTHFIDISWGDCGITRGEDTKIHAGAKGAALSCSQNHNPYIWISVNLGPKIKELFAGGNR